jgi:hypothetical protein
MSTSSVENILSTCSTSIISIMSTSTTAVFLNNTPNLESRQPGNPRLQATEAEA